MKHGGGQTSGRAMRGPPSFDPRDFQGFSYFLGAPRGKQRSTWGKDPAETRKVFDALYVSLPRDQLGDNTNIPSGYTYLLQLLAHDLVQSTEPLWVAADADIPVSNRRTGTLQLDTLYGGGPTVCPLAFAPATRAAPDFATKLRLGRVSDAQQFADQCLARDLARVVLPVPPERVTTKNSAAAPANSGPMADSGAAISTAHAAAPRANGGPMANFYDTATQLYIADPRNGEGAILSQLVVLFFILHNGVVDRLSALPPSAQFAYARVMVLRIYRSVLRHDLLKRLLHESIYAKLSARAAASGDWLWHGSAIPYEFSHGAFRIGHAMTRPTYRLNERLGHDPGIDELLGGAIFRNGPLPSNWILEWSRFFKLGGALNYACKFAATQKLALNNSNLLTIVDASTFAGMPSNNTISVRDWLSATAARMWRTDALVNALSEHYRGLRFLRPTQIAEWLLELIQARANDDEKAILRSRLSDLAGDLPLPLYVMLESQMDPDVLGERVGVLGSILIGEVLFRRLAEEDEAAEHDPLTHAAREAVGDANWAEIESIRDMPALVRLAEKWGGLEQCQTLPFIVQPVQ